MNKLAISLSLLASSAAFTPAYNAWAAEQYTVTESVLLDASADQVWTLVKGFDALDQWHPAVTKTEIVTGEVPLRGTVRVLTVGDNVGTVQETLTAYSDQNRSFSYVINSTDALPVKDYASTVSVVAIGDNLSMVIWNGDFMSNPPEGQPDTMAQETMSTVYRAGLDQLQGLLGQ